jgi:hypothetical protein
LLLVQAPSRVADIPEIVRKAKPAVVQLVTYDAKGRVLATGSGFFINDLGLLLTNAHVLRGAQKVYARAYNGTIYPLAPSEPPLDGLDIQALNFEVPHDFPFLRTGSLEAGEGQGVLVIGNPEGLEGTVSDGIVSAIREEGNVIQITAPISPGSSGSPVLNEEGEVVAVATQTATEGQNLNFAISVGAIEKKARGPIQATFAAASFLHRLNEIIGLSPDQQEQAWPIVERYEFDILPAKEWYDAQRPSAEAQREFFEKLDAPYRQFWFGFSEILTPAQNEKFAAEWHMPK